MYSMVFLEKESETPETIIYKYGPKDELSGRITIKKNADMSKDTPEGIAPVNCDKPDFFFRRAAMRLAGYLRNNEFPDKDFIATGL